MEVVGAICCILQKKVLLLTPKGSRNWIKEIRFLCKETFCDGGTCSKQIVESLFVWTLFKDERRKKTSVIGRNGTPTIVPHNLKSWWHIVFFFPQKKKWKEFTIRSENYTIVYNSSKEKEFPQNSKQTQRGIFYFSAKIFLWIVVRKSRDVFNLL